MLSLKSIKITPVILNLIVEIDEFKGSWNALEKHTTALQLLGDVANFGQKFKEVLEPWQDKKLDEDVLKKLHRVIMGGKSTGEYKTTHFPLIIQKGTEIIGTLDTAAPDEAQAIMGKLIAWLDQALTERQHHPLVVIALFTAVFLQISPFEKGNQRLVRLLIVLLMLRAGYTYAPYSALEPIINQRLHEYYEALSHTQETLETTQPDWEKWLVFFLLVLRSQKGLLLEKMAQGGDAMAKLPTLSGKILKQFENHERLSMKEIERLTRGRRSTLKLRLGELVNEGYLMRHGKARATWYSRV